MKAQLTRKDAKLRTVERKTIEMSHLFTSFNEYIGRPTEVITKARLFDKAIMKLGSLIRAKMIHIILDYTMKMEKLLEEMQVFMNGFNLVLLEAILDISKFSEIPTAEILQGLSFPTKTTRTNLGSSGLPIEPSSNARTRLEAMEEPTTTLPKVIATALEIPAQVPSLPSGPAPNISPLPAQSQAKVTSAFPTTSAPTIA